MQLSFRWYGPESEKITLQQIAQIPGCTGIVGINAEMVNRLRKDGYDIPVLEAAQCAMTLLELYAKMGLYQSRETYMEPPKKG